MHALCGANVPYEEMMADVTCPEYLVERLQMLWENQRIPAGLSTSTGTGDVKVSDYRIMKEVIESLDVSSDDGTDPRRVLYDTLYRYLVLIDFDETCDNVFEDNPVYDIIVDVLHATPNSNATTSRRLRKQNADETKRAAARAQYAEQKNMWNWQFGVHPHMARYDNIASRFLQLLALSHCHCHCSRYCSVNFDVYFLLNLLG